MKEFYPDIGKNHGSVRSAGLSVFQNRIKLFLAHLSSNGMSYYMSGGIFLPKIYKTYRIEKNCYTAGYGVTVFFYSTSSNFLTTASISLFWRSL